MNEIPPVRLRLYVLSFITAAVCLAAAIYDSSRTVTPAPITSTSSTPATTSSTTSTTAPPTTSTSTTTTTTLPPGDWQCPNVVAIAVGVFPPAELWTVDRVAYRESRCDPNALNDSGLNGSGGRDWSLGLFQINVLGTLWPDRQATCGLTAPEQLYDPVVNVQCAYALWLRSGWAPWGMQ